MLLQTHLSGFGIIIDNPHADRLNTLKEQNRHVWIYKRHTSIRRAHHMQEWWVWLYIHYCITIRGIVMNKCDYPCDFHDILYFSRVVAEDEWYLLESLPCSLRKRQEEQQWKRGPLLLLYWIKCCWFLGYLLLLSLFFVYSNSGQQIRQSYR